MSAENLKGCRPHARNLFDTREGVVDHSTKSSGGGSKDPIPLKSVSAGKTHSAQGVDRLKSLPPKSGKQLKTYQDIAQFLGVSRMTLFRWLKVRPFPKSCWNKYYCYHNHHLRIDSYLVISWLRSLITEHPYSKARYQWKRIIRNVT